jgi:hypothetical protein
MKPCRLLVVLAAILSLAAAPPSPTAREIAIFREIGPTTRSYEPQPIGDWEAELRRLSSGRGLDRAADALAPRYGLATANMRTLVRLWVIVKGRSIALARDEAGSAELRRELLALLVATRRAPLVLQAVAESLDELRACSEADFAALMQGSTDPANDAWTIASAATCGDNFLRAAAAAPDRAMPALIRLAHYGTLKPRDALPLYEWLTRPEQLARIAEADRPRLAAWLYARRAEWLFRTGLTERAVALLERLPEDVRAHVLTQQAGSFTAQVDGFPVTFTIDRTNEELKLALASAYAVAGRATEAEALFVSLTRLAAARHAFACASGFDDAAPRPDCRTIPYEDSLNSTMDLILLDHLLHHPDDDPYPLAEIGFSGGEPANGDLLTELRCRVFAEPRFAEFCDNARRFRLENARPEPGPYETEEPRNGAAVAAIGLPGFAESRTALIGEFRRMRAEGPSLPDRDFRRRTVTAPASPFAELPLPEFARGPRPPASRPPAGMAALPDGFLPVRFERNGARAVAISVSQTYDPTGEVSQGGYWVHLSSDGGRSWARPLYTGLAQAFPYVVPDSSRLPLLNGDRLDLEVEVAELDTASITYPPVALATRRRASSLYLQIPLEALARDGNGDGVTDIAAERLLLDRARTDGGTPFVAGSDSRAGCGPPPAEREALIGLMQQLFHVSSAAIVEPIDRPPGNPLSLAGWGRAAAAVDQPIFILGEPRDYLCLAPDRLMIVYGAADIEELRRFRPDFHAMEMPRIVYNRARNRGYVRWSTGWAGGTYRLRLVGGRWLFEPISSWIT